MNYGTEIRIVAADDQGAYPRRWFIWGGEVQGVGSVPCDVRQNPTGDKVRIDIPTTSPVPRCRVDVTTASGNLYHEHIVSNPTNACLAWVECGYRQRDE